MYTNILNLLENYMLIGDNLNVDFYNNKFKNQRTLHQNDGTHRNNDTQQPHDTRKYDGTHRNNDTQQPHNTQQQLSHHNGKNDIYIVRQRDSLFWTFYILKYGIFFYEMNVCSQSFSTEKQEKFKYIELIRQNKDLLKLHKIQKLSSLENELANEKNISIKTFISMCIIENINVYLINDRKIYANILDESLPINIIFKNKNKPNYCIDFNTSENKINNYKENYLIMSSFENKLKSINSYTINDLLEICRKLNLIISTEEKITKKYLYDFLSEHY